MLFSFEETLFIRNLFAQNCAVQQYTQMSFERSRRQVELKCAKEKDSLHNARIKFSMIIIYVVAASRNDIAMFVLCQLTWALVVHTT